MIDHQIMDTGGKPEYRVVRRGKRRNPLLIVELKRPERWNDAGKEQLVSLLWAHNNINWNIHELHEYYTSDSVQIG